VHGREEKHQGATSDKKIAGSAKRDFIKRKKDKNSG
jgi:hypothetical protein